MADRIKNYQQEAEQITILKDIRTDLSVTPSSYTPDTSTATRDRVVTFSQAEEELVVLGDIGKGVKQQVTEVDIAQKDIANIKALLQGHLYDYQTDTDFAYTKTVPSGAMPYAGLEKVGGRTVVMNQAEPGISSADWEQYSSTYTSVSFFDGVATVTVIDDSSSSGYRYGFGKKTAHSIISGHVYIFLYDIRSNNAGTSFSDEAITTGGGFTNVATNANQWYSFGSIQTANKSTTKCLIKPLNNYTGLIFDVRNVMLVDMTLMFGAGNEPSTVEEFQQMFPADYYAYNEGELLSAGVTDVISKDANNATLQTISIPTSIRNLEGYGWSAGDVYNYIDYERKVFVQNVGRVDLGNLDWTYDSYSGVYYFQTYVSGIKSSTKNNINSAYVNSMQTSISNVSDKQTMTANTAFRVRDDSYTDATTFKTAMNGVYLYYELATPIETDISAYLTDDNLIQVESGGTLTFLNNNGDNYRIPVPSEETYMINLQEAVSNG